MKARPRETDLSALRLALRLARRGYGTTSPNPMVGAVLVKKGRIIGRGWHRHAGGPHAEIEALRDAQKRGHAPRGATLYVTLEPCCTHGRTPPCTEAIIAAGIRRVVVGAVDPNPRHAGRGFGILRRAGIEVSSFGVPRLRGPATERQPGRLKAELQTVAGECARLNEAFNHWIVHRTPFVTVKAAMTLDGKIATVRGESKWITGPAARAYGMKLRQGSDAILVGVNTVLADDPSLTVRGTPVTGPARTGLPKKRAGTEVVAPGLRRIVLDSLARTPLSAKLVADEHAALTTIVVSHRAPKSRVAALGRRVKILMSPTVKSSSPVTRHPSLDLRWLLRKLGGENVTRLLVEGGGEVNASFVLGGFAQRVVFFYAPKILGGQEARRGVAGGGAAGRKEIIQLCDVRWQKLGEDLLLSGLIAK